MHKGTYGTFIDDRPATVTYYYYDPIPEGKYSPPEPPVVEIISIKVENENHDSIGIFLPEDEEERIIESIIESERM